MDGEAGWDGDYRTKKKGKTKGAPLLGFYPEYLGKFHFGDERDWRTSQFRGEIQRHKVEGSNQMIVL